MPYLNLSDRYNNELQVRPVMLMDIAEVAELVPKVIDMLMLGGTLLEKYRCTDELTLTEQKEALQEILKYATRDVSNAYSLDVHMAKLAFKHYIGLGRMMDTMEQYKSGSVVLDRNGNEHMVYSYLITDFEKAMELLQKIDTVNMANNIIDEESKAAMLEIVYLALDCREDREDIAKYLDAEFARKAIRIYFDLPMVE
ncbi:hypothetical protein M7775_08005 [Sporomusa sphaeroides DSM 2875]|uniref:hypothetical protein n=1 Tax=Sporomusa sphaeroides TaxID=47679 RepID=UPI00202FC23C|nr:hypothetical protein [Sporomusa sphaeroides]MCM0758513.1 hypothetical protein [Sporomusa sphaeroides DSM 2875]